MLHPLGASVFLTRDQLEEVFPKVLEGIAREHLEPVTVFA
jgi:hypothetical protein